MKKILAIVLLFAPSFALANVRINEVAWMGTLTSSNDEWIELYNDDDTSISVDNWMISISAKKLSGTIQSKGYYLLERTNDTTVPNIAADFIYTGALVDGGVRLVLQNESGAEVDAVEASGGWEKGDNTTKETMQWNGTAWITAPATPRAENKTIDTSATETPNTDTDTDTDTDTNPETSPSSVLDTSAHMSALPLSKFSQKQELFLSAGRNRIVAAGSPISFEAFAIDAKGVKNPAISAKWSFGDGGEFGGTTVRHAYAYPGEYVVILHANAGGNEAVSRAEIKVFAPKISISTEEDGAVSLFNNSEYEINIGEWKISRESGTFAFAEDTIIKAGKKIIFPKTVTTVDFSGSESIKLFSPAGAVVAVFEKKKTETPILIAAAAIPPIVDAPVSKVAKAPLPAEIPPAPIQEQTKRQMAVSMFAVSGKEAPEAKGEEETPAEKIIIKKPESWFEKLWNFIF